MGTLSALRYTGQAVVVTAPKKLKTGRELQLASMSMLTSKTSSQHFFLRIIKVIIQLREAARFANKGRKQAASANSSNTGMLGDGFESILEQILEN